MHADARGLFKPDHQRAFACIRGSYFYRSTFRQACGVRFNEMGPRMHTDVEGLNRITEQIIGAAMRVQNTLGVGFLEKVYENALAHELSTTGLIVAQQYDIIVLYNGVVVGEYTVDLLVADQVLVELKAVNALDDIHRAQCLNYLKATGPQSLPADQFGKPRIEIKRLVLDL